MTTNEERSNPNTEQTPAPETTKTENPPLEDKQLEDVAGGVLKTPYKCVSCGDMFISAAIPPFVKCKRCGSKRVEITNLRGLL
jgi:predicted Zn-ribbon and HTH transcriptional regulator